MFCVLDDLGSRSISQQDRWAAINALSLTAAVPESVLIHYETARNLYLYAWNVYRFHVVAEQQVLATLEFALRLRAEQLTLIDQAERRKPGLSQLLQLAQGHGLISNKRLRARRKWAIGLAAARRDLEQVQFMETHGLTSLELSDAPAKPTEEDLAHDWIGIFVGSLPKIRNQYAHGSPMLHATVLRTFEIVAELVDQLFEPA